MIATSAPRTAAFRGSRTTRIGCKAKTPWREPEYHELEQAHLIGARGRVLLGRLEARGVVVRDGVRAAAHRRADERSARRGGEEVGRRPFEPGGRLLAREDDRHPVVHAR